MNSFAEYLHLWVKWIQNTGYETCSSAVRWPPWSLEFRVQEEEYEILYTDEGRG